MSTTRPRVSGTSSLRAKKEIFWSMPSSSTSKSSRARAVTSLPCASRTEKPTLTNCTSARNSACWPGPQSGNKHTHIQSRTGCIPDDTAERLRGVAGIRLPREMRGESQIKQRADGNHRAVRQTDGFGVMDIQLLLAGIGGAAAFHLIENISHVPKGALDALAYRDQDQSHDAADNGGDNEDPEPVRHADDGADRSHQFDVARAHGAQHIKCQVAKESDGKPNERMTKPGPAPEEAVQGQPQQDTAY